MQKLKRWIKVLSQKVLGYLLFYVEDVGKRKQAYEILNQKKEKPVQAHRQQLTIFDIQRVVV